ncbi:MAG: hypothetical protein LBC18_15360, partial [Opitutaceae bacterium]|nr:hypothetical protein [Opitutaceae bacterium]
MKKSLHHNDRMAAARGFFLIATALTLGWGLPTANAADGTYTGNVNANWNVTANWKDGAVADGAGYTATIDRTGFTATRTVTLDSDRTIGSVLVIGAPSQSRNAIIAGTKTLTLNGGSSPSVISNHGWGSANVNPSVISLASDLVVINAPINGSTGEASSGYVTLGNATSSVVSAGGVRTITTQPSTSVTTVSPVNPNDWRIVLSGTVAD